MVSWLNTSGAKATNLKAADQFTPFFGIGIRLSSMKESFMKFTGYGAGSTPEEAAANARADLQGQIATFHYGNLIAQGIGGLIAIGMTLVLQFFFRPLPTLVVGLAGWIALQIIFAVLGSALPDHPLGAVLTLFFIGAAAIPTLAPIAAAIAVAATFVEVFERHVMNRLPDLPRIALVGVSALMPTLFAIVMLGQSFNNGTLASSGWSTVIGLVIYSAIQIAVIYSRQNTGTQLMDYNWFGRRFAPNTATAQAGAVKKSA